MRKMERLAKVKVKVFLPKSIAVVEVAAAAWEALAMVAAVVVVVVVAVVVAAIDLAHCVYGDGVCVLQMGTHRFLEQSLLVFLGSQ